MSSSAAAHPSTPKRQSLHSLPSCPPAPKRPQPQQPANNDSMMIDFDLPAVPALNLQQLDLSHSTPITLKPRRSNNHKFPTNLRGRSPLKAHRTAKHSSRLGSPRLGSSANLAQTFAHINMTRAFAATTLASTTANSTTNGGTNSKRRMSKLSPQLSYPPLNRQQQQQGRHRSASFGSPAA